MSRLGSVCWVLICASVAFGQAPADDLRRTKDAKIVETLMRLPGFDLNSKPEAKAAALRHSQTLYGTEEFATLVEKLHLVDAAPDLLKQALEQPESNLGVQCARLLIQFDKGELLHESMQHAKEETALAAIVVTGLVESNKSTPWFIEILEQAETKQSRKVAAVQALGKTSGGQKELLKLVEANKIATDLKFSIANVLLNSLDDSIKTSAAKHLTLPATADSKPLPPVSELVKQSGNATAGKVIFETKGTCQKCHVINMQGKEVGPNLSEIGTKLSREALYVSILDPSAGVSHSFETYTLVTDEGQVISGILVSETADAVTLKTSDAILRTVPRGEIEDFKKLKTSLMPSDLQRQITGQELVDLVEYLTTLKKQ